MPRNPHSSFETFTPADLDRFARGYPHYVELVDGHPHDKKAAKWAVEHAGGVDRVYETQWPREVARLWAHTFPRHSGFNAKGNCEAIHPDFIAQLAVVGPPTEDSFAARLDLFMPGSQTYSGWKMPPALYIHEVLLGGEATARQLVRRLDRYSKKEWAMDELDDHTQEALEAIGWMCVRMSPAARTRIADEIAAVVAKRPKNQMLTRFVALLPDHDCAPDEVSTQGRPYFMDNLSRSGAARRTSAERSNEYPTPDVDAQYFFLEGCELLLKRERFEFTYLPKMALMRDLEVAGMIRHPGTVRLIAHLGGVHFMRKPVKAWVDAHADYVAEVLPSLAFDPDVEKLLAKCDALPSTAAKPVKKPAKKPAKPAKTATSRR
jgi:hypothetical protein